ncbi:MAG: hypothetical protein J7500_00545 [Sphingomonas sp.]|uniref:hypothetical protein n=1 Tax=Sphingomonas sp. TaxID=28214 RepID=UPI001B174A3F|nr:hypothetical protein [Sphingomonas sp.]MBO9621176.1 hypothetical protein [Sphingomonas sp.]
MLRRRRIMVIGAAALLAFAAFAPSTPHADIRILAHDSADRAPQRLEAAVDTGVFAVSLLVTWSRHLAR